MAATLSDVARRADIPEATASRVMNGRRCVAATTRSRVEAIARELDYVPHRAARDLSMATPGHGDSSRRAAACTDRTC